jgi:hypothetical protein
MVIHSNPNNNVYTHRDQYCAYGTECRCHGPPDQNGNRCNRGTCFTRYSGRSHIPARNFVPRLRSDRTRDAWDCSNRDVRSVLPHRCGYLLDEIRNKVTGVVRSSRLHPVSFDSAEEKDNARPSAGVTSARTTWLFGPSPVTNSSIRTGKSRNHRMRASDACQTL